MYNYEEDLLKVLNAISRDISRMADAQERTANVLERLYSRQTNSNTSSSSTTKSGIDLNNLLI